MSTAGRPDGLRLALQRQLDTVAREIGAASGAIVIVEGAAGQLEIAAAYELPGPAFDALARAITDPRHPIARTVETGTATYDLRPMNPGGPALRTHVPLIARRPARPARASGSTSTGAPVRTSMRMRWLLFRPRMNTD